MKTEVILFSSQVGLCIHLSSKLEVSKHPKVVASPPSRQGIMPLHSLFLP